MRRDTTVGEPELSANAREVLAARYLEKGPDGRPAETPADLFHRVAEAVAEAERLHGASEAAAREVADAFYGLMASRRFMPNSPTLMNAGRPLGMLSACFVLPVPDSMHGIFTTLHHAALIQKAGGGTGFDFSRLRPRGDRIATSGGSTSGPVSFMKVYSEATGAITQGAFRRGANMGMLRVDHPDVLEFIRAKEDLRVLTNFNVSVSLTDEFMEAATTAPGTPHRVANPRDGTRRPLVDAEGHGWTVGEVFDLIVQKAWSTAEPGVVFIDRVNRDNPTPALGPIEATNPCGEQPLLPYEACNLGSINLERFVAVGDGPPRLDEEGLVGAVRLATRFLDDVIDVNRYPVPEIEAVCKGNRKVGLGLMGFADALFRMGLAYDSPEAVAFGGRAMRVLDEASHLMSEDLARERGVFPNWAGSLWEARGRRLRNATTSTVAPTGTISIIAGCSGGIEPVFGLAFHRNVLDGRRLVETNPVFHEAAEAGGWGSEGLSERLVREGGLRAVEG
ncbi:MAG: adenosylcobalamin-dependent ribonucleoside-diphosphate reductase, partial [Planctomycetes bacterium]|nr:adenosylcobalamin-dependent ribonucleoside-diphosphate reductase [Planctomycetota bacterium]